MIQGIFNDDCMEFTIAKKQEADRKKKEAEEEAARLEEEARKAAEEAAKAEDSVTAAFTAEIKIEGQKSTTELIEEAELELMLLQQKGASEDEIAKANGKL